MQAGVFCFFHWYQRHFEFQLAHVAVEGRSNVVRNTHAWLQISLLTRFLSLLHWASQCAFGDGMCRLHVQQFFSLLLSLKQQSLMKILFSCIHFLIWPYPPKNYDFILFYTSKLYGLTGMQWQEIQPSDVWKMFNTTKSSTAMSGEKCSTQHKVQACGENFQHNIKYSQVMWSTAKSCVNLFNTTQSTAKWCVKNV